MSRPPFSLTDDQARDLVQRVMPLLDRYPVDPRDHRPFLRAFIRAVHAVTGKLYGPDIYRRLLRAYAPGRSPSTSTIATERSDLERELAAAVPSAVPSSAGSPLLLPAASAPALDISLIRTAFAEQLPQFARLAVQAGRDTQVEYLQARLRDAERATADAKAAAARLAAELQEQTGRAALLTRELETSQAALAAQQQVVASLTEELKGQRQFAMAAIEMGRGETRLVKERVVELQAKNERLETMVDQLRMARGNSGGMR
jgi:signal transduction histidine kinase